MPEQITPQNIEDVFKYQPPSEAQRLIHGEVQEAFVDIGFFLLETVPQCPERTLAIRKLQEAKMWANAAVAHDGKY